MIKYIYCFWTVFAFALLASRSEGCFAYTSRSVAVDSNILVYDGMVLFAQGTGSLTRIELATGSVVDRISPPDGFGFSGTLYLRDEGIILADYDRTTLLDADTLEIRWTIHDTHDSAIGEHHLIAHDGYHTVTCFELETGRKLWSKSLEGGWRLLAEDGMAVIFTPDYYDQDQAMWVFDMSRGDKLFERHADPGQLFLNVYADGETVYLLTGRREPGEIDAVPLRLISLDKSGNELANIDVQSNEVTWEYGHKTAGNSFFMGKRCFSVDGCVRDMWAHEQELLKNAWKVEDAVNYSLPSGIFIEDSIRDSKGERGTLLKFERPDGEWQGYASHLGEDGWIGQYVEANGCLVVSTSLGHVECIDLATGNARWLYVFPVIRRTVSYSSNAMPPMLTQRAADYRKALENLGAAGGTLPYPRDATPSKQVLSDIRKAVPYSGRIIVDPSPDDPYARLIPKLVRRSMALAVFPAAIIAALICLLWICLRVFRGAEAASPRFSAVHYGILSVFALVLTFSPILGLLLYGRVDPMVTLCLGTSAAACVGFAAYAGYKVASIRRSAAKTC